jgi:hypothetical protein
MDTNRIEAVGATVGTAGSLAACLADASAVLQCLVGIATLAWWVRLWIRDPNLKPPQIPK